jgi:hypothetical protein
LYGLFHCLFRGDIHYLIICLKAAFSEFFIFIIFIIFVLTCLIPVLC